ncbi:PD40 domain-containing protein [Cryptosporangium japonicum]|uniref:PD40 domain-containing protein n=2 Tax=Cryptosporangium japonicum TaxID=80872 RepID=A0ABP3D2R9_9ACTN
MAGSLSGGIIGLVVAVGVGLFGTQPGFGDDRLPVGATVRVSVSSTGGQANGWSGRSSVSADGRWVTFASDATNLIPDDTGHHVFAYEYATGHLVRVSASTNAEPNPDGGRMPVISADGNRVAYRSTSNVLVPGDTDGRADIFVRDLPTGRTTRVLPAPDQPPSPPSLDAAGRLVASGHLIADTATGRVVDVNVTPTGQPANGRVSSLTLSGNGRFAAFWSTSTDLVQELPVVHRKVSPATWGMFVRDLSRRTTRQALWWVDLTHRPQPTGLAMNYDGRYVAYYENGNGRILKRDVWRDTNLLVADANQQSAWQIPDTPSISADGRYVAFSSEWGRDLVFPRGPSYGPVIYVKDTTTGTSQSIRPSGTGSSGTGGPVIRYPSLSADGRFLSFTTNAEGQVPGDTNYLPDVFLTRLR